MRVTGLPLMSTCAERTSGAAPPPLYLDPAVLELPEAYRDPAAVPVPAYRDPDKATVYSGASPH